MGSGWNSVSTADSAGILARLIAQGYSKDEAARLIESGYTAATGVNTDPAVMAVGGRPPGAGSGISNSGILDGAIFGIPTKLLLVGGLAYLFLKGK